MKLKYLTLLLSICIVNSQDPIDTVSGRVAELTSQFELLTKTVSSLDSLLITKANQSLTNDKIELLDKSYTELSTNLNSTVKSINSSLKQIEVQLNNSITNLEKNVNQNLSKTNSQLTEINNFIKLLSDSLLTTKENILKFQEEISYGKAFEKARLELGPNQEFEWKGKRFTTNYSGEKLIVIEKIEILEVTLEKKVKELDNAIAKANSQITILDDSIEKVNAERENQIITLDRTINKTISDRTLYWIIAILIVLISVVAVFFFLKSKVSEQQDSLSFVKNTQEKLEKEAIKLDEKTIDLIENQLSVLKLQPQSSKEVNHSLPITVAGEIQRIRNRLKHMPQDEQATKVIRKRVESLEDAIKEMGYELIQLEGKPYDEGMTIHAQFVPNEKLKKGERIIDRVIKPQVNYDGKLIQVAEVQVNQGV